MRRLLRLKAVMKMTGLSRSTIYGMIARGEFPVQIRISTRCVGWNSSEIDTWIEEKITGQIRCDFLIQSLKQSECRCSEALKETGKKYYEARI